MPPAEWSVLKIRVWWVFYNCYPIYYMLYYNLLTTITFLIAHMKLRKCTFPATQGMDGC